MIDLHCHTKASDGQHPPAELVRLAHEAGLHALAVTDHDTLAGIAEAQEAARKLGVRLIPGIELSAFVDGKEAHILGHFLDPDAGRLRDFSRVLRAEREKRMVKMIARLKDLGIEVSMDEVVAVSSGKNLGRPHLARVLIAHGHVRSLQEAFDRYIGPDAPAYVQRYKLTTKEAIALIREAGGTATLAHARVSGIGRDLIAQLKDEGLVGLEVNHSDHSPEVRAELTQLARELDLVPTAGSDFHGQAVVPGRTLGATEMDDEALRQLEARAARNGRT